MCVCLSVRLSVYLPVYTSICPLAHVFMNVVSCIYPILLESVMAGCPSYEVVSHILFTLNTLYIPVPSPPPSLLIPLRPSLYLHPLITPSLYIYIYMYDIQATVWSSSLYGALVGFQRFLRAQCRDWLRNVVNLMTYRWVQSKELFSYSDDRDIHAEVQIIWIEMNWDKAEDNTYYTACRSYQWSNLILYSLTTIVESSPSFQAAALFSLSILGNSNIYIHIHINFTVDFSIYCSDLRDRLGVLREGCTKCLHRWEKRRERIRCQGKRCHMKGTDVMWREEKRRRESEEKEREVMWCDVMSSAVQITHRISQSACLSVCLLYSQSVNVSISSALVP